MAWYNSRRGLTHTSVYRGHRELDREASKAAIHGWMIAGMTQDKSRVAVRRSLLRAIIFPLLIFGLARTRPKITVVFVRGSR